MPDLTPADVAEIERSPAELRRLHSRGARKAADAIDHLLSRMRALEAALAPFVALADEIDAMAAETGISREGWAKACWWEDLERAREAYRAAQDPS